MVLFQALKSKLVGGVLVTLATCSLSVAGPVSLFSDPYNVLVFTSLKESSDIGGRAAAGTTFSGAIPVGNEHQSPVAGLYDVVAGQGVASGQIQVNSGGKAYVAGGVLGSSVLMNGGGSLVNSGPVPIDFASTRSLAQDLSNRLSGLTATGVFSSGKITATSTGVNVFNLSSSDYAQLTNIATDGGTVIVNVAGTPGQSQSMFVDGQQNTAGLTISSKVLFNFYQDSGTLTLGNAFGGSVLAPSATISGNSQFNGSIVANALDFQGEIHSCGEFVGDLPTSTPEPASMALSGLALTIIGMWARRRHRRS